MRLVYFEDAIGFLDYAIGFLLDDMGLVILDWFIKFDFLVYLLYPIRFYFFENVEGCLDEPIPPPLFFCFLEETGV